MQLSDASTNFCHRFSGMDKCRILGEFIAATGPHRQRAFRLLDQSTYPPVHRKLPAGRRTVGEIAREAAIPAYLSSEHTCNRGLKAAPSACRSPSIATVTCNRKTWQGLSFQRLRVHLRLRRYPAAASEADTRSGRQSSLPRPKSRQSEIGRTRTGQWAGRTSRGQWSGWSHGHQPPLPSRQPIYRNVKHSGQSPKKKEMAFMQRIARMEHPLLDQLQANLDLRHKLEPDFPGRWVIIHLGQLHGACRSFEDA